MASLKGIVLQVVTFLLIFIFTMAGLLKLTSAVNADVHNEMKDNFRSFARIWPLAPLRFDPDLYRIAVGCSELVCSVLLFLGDRKAKTTANVALIVILIGAAYTHWAVGDPLEKMVPAIVCLSLCILRLYLRGHNSVELKIKIK